MKVFGLPVAFYAPFYSVFRLTAPGTGCGDVNVPEKQIGFVFPVLFENRISELCGGHSQQGFPLFWITLNALQWFPAQR